MPDVEPIQSSPRTADEDVRRIFFGLPTFEVRDISGWVAAFPMSVSLQTGQPLFVSINAWETGDRTAAVGAAVVDYYVSEGGITITDISGLSAGTEYDLTLFVVGGRG